MVELTQIGYAAKPHGKEGFIKLDVEDSLKSITLNTRAIFFNLEGSMVPFLIESITEVPRLMVKLEEIEDPQEAATISNTTIHLPSNEVPEELINDELSGIESLQNYMVFDQAENEVGIINRVEVLPYQTLLYLQHGKKEIILPFHEDLLIHLDPSEKSIQLEIADGLI